MPTAGVGAGPGLACGACNAHHGERRPKLVLGFLDVDVSVGFRMPRQTHSYVIDDYIEYVKTILGVQTRLRCKFRPLYYI